MEPKNKRKNRNFWIQKIEEAKAFQGSQREFCQNHDLHPNHFYGWKSRLKKAAKATKENSEGKKAFITAVLASPPVYKSPEESSFKKSKELMSAEWVAEFVTHLWRMSR